MKLSKYHKATFVEGVMRDVPKVSFDDQVGKIVHDDMVNKASPALKAALADREVRSMLFGAGNAFRPDSVKINNETFSCYAIGVTCVAIHRDYTPSPEAQAKIAEVMTAAAHQHIARLQLQDKVTGAINACSTLKVALERMPEFAKYLPEEASKTAFLPAIANLAADLMTAGWTPGKAPVAA